MLDTKSIGDDKFIRTWVFSRDPGQIYKIETVICDNPFCSCTEIDLRFLDISKGNEFSFDVTLDISKRVQLNSKANGDSTQEKFAKLFIDEITEADWLKLYQLFYIVKAESIESYDYETETNGTLPIDIEDTEINGTMLGYNEIFPHGTQITLNINDAEYLLDEQFCAMSDCNCTNDSLGLYPLKDGKLIGEPQVFMLDYKTRSLKAKTEPSVGFPSTHELLQALRKHPLTAFTQIKKRHSRIKLVYRKYKDQMHWEEIPQLAAVTSSKIGRNDPCPCGSGKKYKHCCL